jgi:D-lactate dehydrogenase
MTQTFPGSDALLSQFRSHVGAEHVLTADRDTRRFRNGYRYGGGKVLAVVRPGTLVEQWRVFKTAVEGGCIVIMQGANTGLTGGSTPYGDNYERPVVVINTLRITRIDLIDGGKQVLCLAGATLHRLEKLIRPLGREPHSVIGSTTIGASVVGGVCNNSGGALIRRGPAFTQLALFARVLDDGSVALVNHLGIELGENAETILGRLDRGDYTPEDIRHDQGVLASDPDYGTLIRDIESPLPARYNNDPRLLFEAAGSAGKLCVFAVRLDTFPSSGPSRVFYIGSNDYLELTNIRRHILKDFATLPVAAEYLHRDAYDLSRRYGKDLFLFLQHIGTERVSTAFALKSQFDAITGRLGLGTNISDRIIQGIVSLLPDHLPKRMNAFRDAYEHHLLLRIDGTGIEEARTYFGSIFPSATGGFFECDDVEAAAAYRHRYAIGGGAARYRALHANDVGSIVAFDLAMPRNTLDWRESMPPGLEDDIVGKSRCGHFFCQVFHYDYIVKKGRDGMEVKHRIMSHLRDRGLEFPSEHNVGHIYTASPTLADFYRGLDPTNTMNPGIGQTSSARHWA